MEFVYKWQGRWRLRRKEGIQWNPKKKGGRVRYESWLETNLEPGRNITKVHKERSEPKQENPPGCLLSDWLVPCCSSYNFQGALNLWNLFVDCRR